MNSGSSILRNQIVNPAGTPIAQVTVDFDYHNFFIEVSVVPLQEGDNCLTRTMAHRNSAPRDLPLKGWKQVVRRNPATIALAHLLLDCEALNLAAGHCVFDDYVSKVIQAIDALWD
jgi:hypothetical protein